MTELGMLVMYLTNNNHLKHYILVDLLSQVNGYMSEIKTNKKSRVLLFFEMEKVALKVLEE